MDCDYKITKTIGGENQLRCRRCKHETISAYGPEMVHTRCRIDEPPPPPTLEQLTKQIHAHLLSRLPAAELTAKWPTIARQIEICHANACGKFRKTACIERGNVCSNEERWVKRLTIGVCEHWND